MKIKQKMLSIAIILCIAIILLPTYTQGEEILPPNQGGIEKEEILTPDLEETEKEEKLPLDLEEKKGENVIQKTSENPEWTLDENGLLTISSDKGMSEWVVAKNETNRDLVKTVVIQEGVTGIAYKAFEHYESLIKVRIPESVTLIGESAFAYCKNLKEIIIPKSVENIGNSAFTACESLKEIIIQEGVVSIGDGAFAYCERLKEIIIPESVTNIGNGAFSACESLKEIIISEGVVSIGNSAFAHCKSLKEIIIPESVASIGNSAFAYCPMLTAITVVDTNTEYSSEDGILLNKDKTELILYPQTKTSTNYTIPETVISIADNAFNRNIYLIEITIPDGVTTIGSAAFENCESLISITIPKGVTKIESYTFGSCESLKEIIIPEGVVSIGEGAFRECESLKEIIIPESVTSIGNGAFNNCMSLSEISIPSSVVSIGERVFYNCNNLAKITVAKDNIAYASEDGVLLNKDKTTLICYPKGKPNVSYTILNTITLIPEKAFEECSLLENINISSSVINIENSAFETCRRLTSIRVEGENTMYSSEEGILFNKNKTKLICYPKGKNNLTYIIPNSVTEIDRNAFSLCQKLNEIKLPEGLIRIGFSSFINCNALKEITIPANVTKINSYAFSYSKTLQQVNFSGNTPPTIAKSIFSNCANPFYINVPAGTQAAYKEAFGAKLPIGAIFGKLPVVDTEPGTGGGGGGAPAPVPPAVIPPVLSAITTLPQVANVPTTAVLESKATSSADGKKDKLLLDSANIDAAIAEAKKIAKARGTEAQGISVMLNVDGRDTADELNITVKRTILDTLLKSNIQSLIITWEGVERNYDISLLTELSKESTGDISLTVIPYTYKEIGHWADKEITYMVNRGILRGTTKTDFAPNTSMTRAMLFAVLARVDKQDLPSGETWYAPSMDWAKTAGISDGNNPNGNITREELAAMLYRYEQKQGGGFKGDWMYLLPFEDKGNISDWAFEAVAWCNMKGIMSGKADKQFDPSANATRAEVATMLCRFLKNMSN